MQSITAQIAAELVLLAQPQQLMRAPGRLQPGRQLLRDRHQAGTRSAQVEHDEQWWQWLGHAPNLSRSGAPRCRRTPQMQS